MSTKDEALKLALEALENHCGNYKLDEAGREQWYKAVAAIKVAMAQRQWIWLSDADIADVIDTTCQYEGCYEAFLIKKAERKSRSMNNET